MKQNRQISRWVRGGKILFLAFLIGVVLRFFVIESVYVSTPQMEKTYSKGDLLFVSKLAYGIHIPFSILYFPIKKVRRNDIILSTIPNFPGKVLSRCIGLPGDTIIVSDGRITINGKPAVSPPSLLTAGSDGKRLSKLERYFLEESQPERPPVNILDKSRPYTVIVPKKGLIVPVDSLTNIPLYEAVFIDENAEKQIFIKNGSLYIDGLKQAYYLFRHNYYWVLSDNRGEGFDSRHFGFIAEQNIEGKALGVWMRLNFLNPRWTRCI